MKKKIYTKEELEDLMRHQPREDLIDLTVYFYKNRHGVPLATTKLLPTGAIALSVLLQCRRCMTVSDEEFLVVRDTQGLWTLVVDTNGDFVADLKTHSFVCDESADEGGIFIPDEEVYAGLLGLSQIMNIAQAMRLTQQEEMNVWRIGDDVDLHMPAPGDERLN